MGPGCRRYGDQEPDGVQAAHVQRAPVEALGLTLILSADVRMLVLNANETVAADGASLGEVRGGGRDGRPAAATRNPTRHRHRSSASRLEGIGEPTTLAGRREFCAPTFVRGEPRR